MQAALPFPAGHGQNRGVSGAAKRDVVKTWLYAGASVGLGAAFAPWLFNAGRALAEVTEHKQTNDLLDRLARVCRAGDFADFYQASLLAAALLLFLPWVGLLDRGGKRMTDSGQALRRLPRGPLHLLTGWFLGLGQFVLVGIALTQAGSFAWRDPQAIPVDGLLGTLLIAVFWVILQEWFFRGMVLGVFLRAMRPFAALLMMALLFTAVRLLAPPAGFQVADDESSQAGFEMLAAAFSRCGNPDFLVSTVLPLIGLGAVLGYARFRTGSLWLPMGLHAGWVVANLAFTTAATPLKRPDPIASALAGPDLFTGIIPLSVILVTGLLIFFFTAPPDARRSTAKT